MVSDPIRVATITPYGERRAVENLLRELEVSHKPRERRDYLPEFEGMSRIFGVRAVVGHPSVHVELPRALDREIVEAARPHDVLSTALAGAIRGLRSLRSDFDAVCIYLPSRWELGFKGLPGEDFDLHDQVKAVAAGLAIPTQILREDEAFTYFCRASVAWRLSIALYMKAGGIPWTLADIPAGTAFIGLSYALRPASQQTPRFVTCCSQVFDDDGAGLEFIAYDTAPDHLDGENPYLSRDEMRRVMARSLDLYQRRNGGRSPDRMVVHKSTAFTDDEIEGALDAFAAVPDVSLVRIQDDSPWLGTHINSPRHGEKRGQPAPYPCRRGTLLPLGGPDALLWTAGNAPEPVGGKNFFKEGKGIPSPLLLRRYTGEGGWEDAAYPVLALTKMNWNNDGLYDRLPTTMGYAQTLARTLKRIGALSPRPYPFRLFM
jgi:hypothetical protein